MVARRTRMRFLCCQSKNQPCSGVVDVDDRLLTLGADIGDLEPSNRHNSARSGSFLPNAPDTELVKPQALA